MSQTGVYAVGSRRQAATNGGSGEAVSGVGSDHLAAEEPHVLGVRAPPERHDEHADAERPVLLDPAADLVGCADEREIGARVEEAEGAEDRLAPAPGLLVVGGDRGERL